ncbi:hypothetical protein ACLF6K_06775 [Streptomyces xanthophaeus]|uniref:hypothetical protein n=1 Tax=Streptomyces xanthophaeus TaxID=67385 RepID=UPI00398F9E2D
MRRMAGEEAQAPMVTVTFAAVSVASVVAAWRAGSAAEAAVLMVLTAVAAFLILGITVYFVVRDRSMQRRLFQADRDGRRAPPVPLRLALQAEQTAQAMASAVSAGVALPVGAAVAALITAGIPGNRAAADLDFIPAVGLWMSSWYVSLGAVYPYVHRTLVTRSRRRLGLES